MVSVCSQFVRDIERPTPPLLIGGVLHVISEDGQGGPFSQAVDFLTASLPTSAALSLVKVTRILQEGNARPGFKRSQERECLGGSCWRRFEPHQPSKLHGLDYESWEFAGQVASTYARLMRDGGEVARPSRGDVAWDYQVRPDVAAEDLARLMAPAAEARGIEISRSGPERRDTWYIGKRGSDRMIRIYRKDLQDETVAHTIGPVLRVELQLRGDAAAAWWMAYVGSDVQGFKVAAAHVVEMTNLTPVIDPGEVPEAVKPDASPEAEKLAQWVRQNAVTVAAVSAAGVPIVKMCQDHVTFTSCRMAKSRLKRRVESITSAGVDHVVSLVKLFLGATPEPVSVPVRAAG